MIQAEITLQKTVARDSASNKKEVHMPKQSEHHANTTEFIDHGAEDHDDKVEWRKNSSGQLSPSKEHVEKGTGGLVTQKPKSKE